MKSILFFSMLGIILLVSCQDAKQNTQSTLPTEPAPEGMVYIPAGTLHMGGDNDQADQNEYPKHDVEIYPFFMDETEVTNEQFSAFVAETGYETVAERALDWEELKKQVPPGTPRPPDSVLMPGALVFTPTTGAVPLNNPAQWWTWTIGANWQHPLGPASSIADIMDHPAVQISWEDADAYCRWAGKRLPTESEWEWAARGGLEDMVYPWGDEDVNDGPPKANFYQGLFPHVNTKNDGYLLTAPVKSYPANGYGLYDMSGNVWEWCQDLFDVSYYGKKSDTANSQSVPDQGYNPMNPYAQERIIRGGSFLCNDDYCSGYRNARRMGSTADTGLNHTGCRCVKDVE